MTETPAAAPKKDVLTAIAVYFERRSLIMLALGFASGLPFLLVSDTLSTWMRDVGVSLHIIGFLTLVTLSYTATFLWAPLLDRVKIPGLYRLLGQRRSWMLVAQLVIMVGLWFLAGTDPMKTLPALFVLAVMVGFAGATQDTAMNGWRIEASAEDRQGVMAAAYAWGRNVSTLVAGAAPLVLAQTYNWHISYAVMAALMAIGILGVLLAPRELAVIPRPLHAEGLRRAPVLELLEWVVRGLLLLLGTLCTVAGLTASALLISAPLSAIGADLAGQWLTTAWASPAAVYLQVLTVFVGLALIAMAATPLKTARTRPGAYLYGALGVPLVDFLDRHKGMAGTILAMICLYRISEFVLNINGAFYLDLGFTKLEIAGVRKFYGLGMTMVGVGLAGFAAARLGIMRALVIGAFAQPLSHVGYVWMSVAGHQMFPFLVGLGLDNIAGAYAGTCLIAYMSSLTSAGFVATQYAMFSSLYALPGKLISTQSGRLVEALARAAEPGHPLAGFRIMFDNLPPGTLTSAMEKSQVSPPALGVGYMLFFVYTGLIGSVGIWLTFKVYNLTKRQGTKLACEAALAADG